MGLATDLRTVSESGIIDKTANNANNNTIIKDTIKLITVSVFLANSNIKNNMNRINNIDTYVIILWLKFQLNKLLFSINTNIE